MRKCIFKVVKRVSELRSTFDTADTISTEQMQALQSHCGTECSNVSELREKNKNIFFSVGLAGIVIVLMFTFILSIFESEKSVSKDVNLNDTSVAVEKNDEEKSENNILYSDDFFDVEYIKIYDVKGITTAYLQLRVINKGSKTVTLLLDDVYVNDITVHSGTALPIELEPGKESRTPFILFTGNTGLAAEDITKVEFKLKGYDDNMNVIHKTAQIVIKM